MRSIAEGLRTYLDAHAPTSGKAVKLEYAEHSDGHESDGTKKAFVIVHQKSSENYVTTDGGDGGTGLRAETFDIVAHAGTQAEARSLADAVSSHLSTVSVPLAMGSDRVALCILEENSQGDFDPELFGDEKGWSIVGCQFWIQHKAA